MEIKRKFMLLAAACFPVMLYAQSNAFVINGKMSKKSLAYKAYILFDDNNQGGGVDSVNVVNGKFQFKGVIDGGASAKLLVLHKAPKPQHTDVLSFYIEPGTINVKAGEWVETASVKGSKLNEAGKKYSKLLEPAENENRDAIQAYNAATPAQKSDSAFVRALQEKQNHSRSEIRRIRTEYIRQNPDQLLSLILLKEKSSIPFNDKVESLFNGLSETLRNSESGKALAGMIEAQRAYAIGAQAPDFTANNTDDRPVSLRDFRGKYVLLDFWASWCMPCRAENPNVVAAYQKYKDNGFTVLGFSLNTEAQKKMWLSAIKEDELNWPQVVDFDSWDSKVVKLYGVKGIPQNFLIDPTGKIIAKNLRGDALAKKLKEVLAR